MRTVEAVSCSREKESERRGIARRNLIDESTQKFCGDRERAVLGLWKFRGGMNRDRSN